MNTDNSNPFSIRWLTNPIPPQFFKHPCEVKVSKGVWQGGTELMARIYLILPVGPTRKCPAYTRVMSVEFQFNSRRSAEPTLRAVIDLIPIRLGVTLTAINWWGYKRGEVIHG